MYKMYAVWFLRKQYPQNLVFHFYLEERVQVSGNKIIMEYPRGQAFCWFDYDIKVGVNYRPTRNFLLSAENCETELILALKSYEASIYGPRK